jgi:hypothetical protein
MAAGKVRGSGLVGLACDLPRLPARHRSPGSGAGQKSQDPPCAVIFSGTGERSAGRPMLNGRGLICVTSWQPIRADTREIHPAYHPHLHSCRKLGMGSHAEPPANVVFSQIPVAIQLVRFCSTVF